MLSRLRSGVVDDGTAIGNGLATALNRLRESGSKSKVVILLTDGVNNRGQISPIMAADIAHDLGIKVYTIGVGSKDKAPMPAYDPFGNITYVMADVEIDEELLRDIASKTGGQYFRASNNEALKAIYEQINQMEKSELTTVRYEEYNEQYQYFIAVALALLLLDLVIMPRRNPKLRKFNIFRQQ